MDVKQTIKNVLSNPRAFFLQNLGLKQTIAKNTFWLAVAEAITRFLKLVLIIYVARILGATEYGKFTFALAFVGLFAIFSDLGVSSITTREFAREREKEKEFPAVLSLKTLLSLGTLVLILIGSFFITSSPTIRGLIWILGVYIIVSGFTGIVFSFFRARQKMEYEAWAKILQALVISGAGFFVLFNFPTVKNLSFAYLFAALSTLIFILFFLHIKFQPIKFEFNKIIWKNYLLMSWPLALAGVFGTIYGQTDSVMMGYWGQITQTGWYNAAYKIIGVTLIPVALITASFYPALSKFFKESKEKLQKAWNYYMELMLFMAAPLVIGGIALAPRIIDFVYDPSYFPSILAFQILIIMAGISCISTPFGQALVVSNQQKKLFWVTLSGAIINVGLNFILIPKYSLYGAAFTTVVTLFLVFFLLYRFTVNLTPIKNPFSRKIVLTFSGTLISSLPMYFVISQPKIYHLHILLSVFIGALIYLICFLLIRKLVNSFNFL